MAFFNVPIGTQKHRFIPPTGIDTTMKCLFPTGISISTRHQCITSMKEYEQKSMEELRLEDYWLRKEISNLWKEKILFKKNDFPIFTDPRTQTEELGANKLRQGLEELLLNNKHSDFILKVKGKEFKVHKIILIAQSPVFAAMLEHDTKEKADNVVNIDDIEPPAITNFLNFLYSGKVEDLSYDSVLDLYEVADKYQVSELIIFCIKYMKNIISVENFCNILSLSLRHHVKELTETVTEFFIQNSTTIAVTTDWKSFIAENPIAGNELFLKALNLNKK